LRLPKRADRWVWGLVAWTLFVWVSRIRLLFGDPEETTTSRITGGGTALLFAVCAVILALALLRRPGQVGRSLLVFCSASSIYWIVRAGLILGRDHDAGFKVVHSVLALVSIGLAFMAWHRRKDASVRSR
jgi:hypothetical protein